MLLSPADGLEELPKKSIYNLIPIQALFSASYTMDKPYTLKLVDNNTTLYLLQELLIVVKKLLAAKGVQDTSTT